MLRGLPGSGKSTFAKKKYPNYIHIEADQWFVRNGKYIFEANQISISHHYCQIATEYNLRRGKSVVVSNTFTQFWEMTPYFELAKKYEIPVAVIEMKGKYKNIHNVPNEILKNMKNRWEIYNSKGVLL